jgi:hypothetical protein
MKFSTLDNYVRDLQVLGAVGWLLQEKVRNTTNYEKFGVGHK